MWSKVVFRPPVLQKFLKCATDLTFLLKKCGKCGLETTLDHDFFGKFWIFATDLTFLRKKCGFCGLQTTFDHKHIAAGGKAKKVV